MYGALAESGTACVNVCVLEQVTCAKSNTFTDKDVHAALTQVSGHSWAVCIVWCGLFAHSIVVCVRVHLYHLSQNLKTCFGDLGLGKASAGLAGNSTPHDTALLFVMSHLEGVFILTRCAHAYVCIGVSLAVRGMHARQGLCIVRASRDSVREVWASLSMTNKIQGTPVALRVRHSAGTGT